MGGSTNASPARADLISRYFIQGGYNTNYAAGWHLVRSGLKFTRDPSGNDGLLYITSTAISDAPFQVSATGPIIGAGGQAKGIGGSLGPLTAQVMDKSRIPSSNVAFMGCSTPGDINEAVAPVAFAKVPGSVFARGDVENKVLIPSGALLSEAFNDGPAYYNSLAATPRITLMNDAVNMRTQANCERGEPTTQGCGQALNATAAAGFYLQDTRDFLALHQGSVNVLMADGSVKGFSDTNGDGYLNPGFPVPTTLTEAQYLNIGYTSSLRELSPDQMFNGVFLSDSFFKGQFEN